ncbi:MAG: c-type cytochrome [Vicinamibacteria bacterium]|nr:c-type cytochrome [Vicinamibacteria bacterium]
MTSFRTLAAVAALCALALPCPAAEPDARVAWATHCATCHGSKGKAPARYAAQGVPDLNDADWQSMRTDKQIRALIADGSKGTQMEPFKARLTAAEIDALVKLVRSFKPAK